MHGLHRLHVNRSSNINFDVDAGIVFRYRINIFGGVVPQIKKGGVSCIKLFSRGAPSFLIIRDPPLPKWQWWTCKTDLITLC